MVSTLVRTTPSGGSGVRDESPAPHPRVTGWLGPTALAMGGSNQSLFLLGALFVGQEAIPGQGSAAVPLLILGLLLSYMAAPGWTELCCMFPNRVGGIAATCSEAFRPYSPILANLTGMCYWWGWVPTCGLTALLSASALHNWLLPGVPVTPMAIGLVLFFAGVNLLGVRWIVRLAVPIAAVSAILAFLSVVVPVFGGRVDWHQAFAFRLTSPFPGTFGRLSSAMAGLYLIGFAAPAFEAAYCHVGEMRDPARSVPRAALASALMAGLYFAVIPVIWLGCLGSEPLGKDLAQELGPVFAPLLGGLGRAAAMAFMVFNMFHGTMAPTAGVCRTLSQLADDGLLPRGFGMRNRFDAPYVATLFTAGCAIVFLLLGDPLWLIAAANFTYLIGISLPSVAVWLLRKDAPTMERPFRAPNWTITLGLIAALGWGTATILGFQQFGLPTVLVGVGLAYSGAVLYAWRKWSDRRKAGLPGLARSLHVKLTGAMMLVLAMDGAGYLLAMNSIDPAQHPAFVAALADIFVVVALLTISVGLVLPGMIAHSAVQVSQAASRLVDGTLADFTKAMVALSRGDLEAAHARISIDPVLIHSRDELGAMGESFNRLQEEVGRAALGLDGAREGLRNARTQLTALNATLEQRVVERTADVANVQKKLVEAAWHAGKAEVAIGVLHNVGNVLNSVNVSASVASGKIRHSRISGLAKAAALLKQHEADLAVFITTDEAGRKLPAFIRALSDHLAAEQGDVLKELDSLSKNVEHIKEIVAMQQSYSRVSGLSEPLNIAELVDDAVRINEAALTRHRVRIVRKFTSVPQIVTERHKLIQILVNLISNAKEAMAGLDPAQRTLTLGIGLAPEHEGAVLIQVRDTGDGITPEHLPRLFTMGFTTRRDGHGFGLHSSILAARNMGGDLTAASEGIGKGATFTLELPIERDALAA